MIALLSMGRNLKPPTILYYLPQTKLFLMPLKILLCVSQMMLAMNDSFQSQSCEQAILKEICFCGQGQPKHCNSPFC